MRDGLSKELKITPAQAVAFATKAAGSFGVKREPIIGSFDGEIARKVLSLNESDRKKLLRQGAVTKQAIELLARKGAKKE